MTWDEMFAENPDAARARLGLALYMFLKDWLGEYAFPSPVVRLPDQRVLFVREWMRRHMGRN